MKNTNANSIAEMVEVASLSVLLLLTATGCGESAYDLSDPILQGIALDEGDKLAAVFSLPQPNMDDIDIEWGPISECTLADKCPRIKIREDLKGQDAAVRCHVRHEMFHAMTGLQDGQQQYCNGVRIAGVIAW